MSTDPNRGYISVATPTPMPQTNWWSNYESLRERALKQAVEYAKPKMLTRNEVLELAEEFFQFLKKGDV